MFPHQKPRLLFFPCVTEFIMTSFAVSSILIVISETSKLLQSVAQNIAFTSNCINYIIKTLNYKRINCDEQCKAMQEKSKHSIIELNVKIKLPRIIK